MDSPTGCEDEECPPRRYSTATPTQRNRRPIPIPAGFFGKTTRINPERIRAENIRNILRNPPPFKLNLGDEPSPVVPVDLPPIFRIPEKIRVKIYKYLSAGERTHSLQLVCRQFHKEIRLRAGIQCFVHQKTWVGLTFLRDVIVESLIVGRYTTPLRSPRNLIIKPRNVRFLTFLEPICVQHFDGFLQRCKSIRHLSLRAPLVFNLAPRTPTNQKKEFEWRGSETIMKYPVILERLWRLTINMRETGNEIQMLPTLYQMLRAKRLRRLSLRIRGGVSLEKTTEVYSTLIPFLEKLPFLTHLLVCTEQDDSFDWSHNIQLGFPESRLIQLGKSMKLREIILTETCVALYTWTVILAQQRHLRVFQVLHLMLVSIPKQVISRSKATLTKVAIHVMLWTEDQHTPLDLALFNKCKKLKELYICIGAPLKCPEQPDLINFHRLPRSIQILQLKNAVFEATKFFRAMRRLKRLSSVGVCLKSKRLHNFAFKFTSGHVRKFLRMRQLNELFISHFKVCDEPENWTTRTKTNEALGLLKAIPPRKNKCVHCPGGNRGRWVRDSTGEFACRLVSDWAS